MSEFATALQRAMDERGYSLGRLAKAATERGAKVSAATLSYWLTGQSKPRRKSSLEVLAAIEDILEQGQGSLMTLAGVTDNEWRMDRPRARRIVPNHPEVDRLIRR